MTKTLYVPDHVAASKNAAVASAYVEKNQKILDPSLVEKNLKERLPQPTGWRLLVMPYMGKDKTDGGVYVPDPVREKEMRATVVAYVVKVGSLAYKDIDKFGEEGAWCKEGDWVCIGRYAGSRFQIEGGEVRIINDDEVIATIVNPDDIKTYGA